MQTHKCTKWTALLALPAVVLFAGASAGAADHGVGGPRIALVHQVAQADDQPYWIGVMGAPVDPLLQKHLRIDAGVLIQHVVPDSPADKAGIKEDDILLKFGDAEVGNVSELAKIIADTKDKESKAVIVHEGKEKTVTVTPAKRPAAVPMPPVPHATELKQLKAWMDKLQKGEFGEHPLRMWSAQPGVVVPKEWKHHHVPNPSRRLQFHLAFPKNTRVSISRSDEGPAKIVVERDDQKWEVTEHELDKLPDDVRPIVKSMLGQRPAIAFPGGEFRLEWDDKRFKGPIPLAPRQLKVIPKEEGAREADKPTPDRDMGDVLKKLDEMNERLREREKETQREMEKLRQEVERLKKTEV